MSGTVPVSRAVIDIGSNSVKCVVAQGFGANRHVIRELTYVTHLGEELVRSNSIGAQGTQRNLDCLLQIRAICDDLQVSSILCVGAETLRRATDTELFASQLNCRTGWRLRVLSPKEEALLSFEAASSLAPEREPYLVIDSGGGSTEFSFGSAEGIKSSCSLPLGALTLTRKHLQSDPPVALELAKLGEEVNFLLSKAFPQPKTLAAIACGGGVSSMACVAQALEHFDASRIQGFWLSGIEIIRQIELYSQLSESERRRIKGLQPGREGIILAGALILAGIAGHFGLKGFRVSARGIRHALLDEKYQDWFQPF